ncbi:MAG: hypothetical protein V4572_11320 [Bacteroidota bacterium]
MKKIYLIIISILLINCQKSKIESKEFFDFDEIEHYNVDITLEDWSIIASKKDEKSVDEKIFLNILNGSDPKTIDDKNFIVNLKKFYPKIVKISSTKLDSIRNIYTEKKHQNPEFAACTPFYRDILIFKKNNNVIGISKVCFECGTQSTIGSKRNTENLGQSGDMWKLESILK